MYNNIVVTCHVYESAPNLTIIGVCRPFVCLGSTPWILNGSGCQLCYIALPTDEMCDKVTMCESQDGNPIGKVLVIIHIM